MGEAQGSKALLDGPMQFHPQREPKGYRFSEKATLAKLVGGVLPSPCEIPGHS
jgi:hypothetical protein